MHNRASFCKHFGSERVNASQKLLKYTKKLFYFTFFSFWAKLCQKKVFSIRFEVLGLLFDTLTATCEYSHSNRENLPLPIQIKLSEIPEIFYGILFAFLVSTGNFQCSESKNKPQKSSVSEVLDSERCAYLNA